MEHILVVDDEVAICDVIAKSLKRASFSVTACTSAKEALTLRLEQFDLMILDVMMPDMDGFELCRNVREKIDCPILFLTAKTTETDVIQGLAMGADDYIRKPFTPSELVSRVNAHIRREKRIHHTVLTDGEIRFLLAAREVRVRDGIVPLTKMEYEICELMIRHRGQVFSREQILDRAGVYWTDSKSAAVVEHIKNIRKKFAPYQVDPIKTIWGIGYKWHVGGTT
jgi:hypothetical protein